MPTTLDRKLAQLSEWIAATAGERGLLIPVSGGTDSALCLWLCHRAAPDQTSAVHFGENLPCREWFERFGPVENVPLPAGPEDKEMGRWARLSSLSMRRRVWLVGSRNRTEDVFGTYSLASRVATYYPLVGVWKTEVMALCQHLGMPEEMLQSSHRADLACGRTELMAEIGIEKVDQFLRMKEGELRAETVVALPEHHRNYLEETYRRGRFKTTLPLRGPVLSEASF